MRLTTIKLAGFKSFVDPTTFHVPGRLVGIVGPNGCGKSNVIDAVRWVLGESSARNLRGESMADVIFNGSSSRKPVGQASIELVFDNDAGKLQGPWAHYSEIAVRRVVSRSGQSQYFLNGSRCRRRDITDLFLGTGLGPRSYAIIEQGMITRVIDAKPEDLRLFLEEAAGISKYKERRRETETRIQHTRDNLARLNDVREEQGKRLEHLKRQARAAEQYKTYRSDERRLKAELLALRTRALDHELAERERELGRQETAFDAVLAEQRQCEAQLEQGRLRLSGLNDDFNQVQERWFALGAEITRLEQAAAHRRQLRQRQREELAHSERSLTDTQDQLVADQVQLEELAVQLAEAQPQAAAAREQEELVRARLDEVEAAQQVVQADWDAFTRRAGEVERAVEVERTRIEHQENQLLQQQRRQARLHLEREQLDLAGLEREHAAAVTQAEDAALVLAQHEEHLNTVISRDDDRRDRQRTLNQAAAGARARLESGRGRLAALETLQEAALGRQDAPLAGLAAAPRLAEQLSVTPGWETAVETVLGMRLQSLGVAALEPLAAQVQQATGSVSLLEMTPAAAVPPAGTLAAQVTAPWALEALLAGIHTAADLPDALRRRQGLSAQESLVTPDGIRVGPNWLSISRADPAAGVLAREREIKSLNATLTETEATLSELDSALSDLDRLRVHLESERRTAQEAVNLAHRDQSRCQAQASTLAQRLTQARQRRTALDAENVELSESATQIAEELAAARWRLEEALQRLEDCQQDRQHLHERRDSLRLTLQSHRADAEQARQAAQRQLLALADLDNRARTLRQSCTRLLQQRDQLRLRRDRLAADLTPDDDPAERAQLEELLAERLLTEDARNHARQERDAQEDALKTLEQRRSRCETTQHQQREHLEALRLTCNELRVRRQTLLDQLRELDLDLPDVLAMLAADATETAWQAQLDLLAQRIQRLGPVNLAAVEEYEQLSERQRYLDAQNDDLLTALATLEEAMAKIDRETRSRFRETFDQVNDGIKQLFPRLFGGGQGYLELTGQDTLEAGVAIMAQPPGKRVGHIHLLSGGEKALTAVALVFAIFQLNPAPFCMLDEVDAPLDEANVGRFGQLVREMAERVQFIFISHNKATMEIAEHLTGVTMQEPGVSRLVAVDVDAAVRLAAV